MRRTIAKECVVDDPIFGSQYTLSRKFKDSSLEAGYRTQLFITWSPRVRRMAVLLLLYQAGHTIHAFACQCGTKIDTFSGPMLYFSFIFPLSCDCCYLAFTCSRYMTRKTAAPGMVAFLLLVTGCYTLPVILGAATNQHPVFGEPLSKLCANTTTANTSFVGMTEFERYGLVASSQGAFFVSTVLVFVSVTVIAASGLGMAPAQSFLLTSIAGSIYYSYSVEVWANSHDLDASVVLSHMILAIVGSFFLAVLVSSANRQQYLVRVLSQQQHDARVEQLRAEKQRLEYERAFAVHQINYTQNELMPPNSEDPSLSDIGGSLFNAEVAAATEAAEAATAAVEVQPTDAAHVGMHVLQAVPELSICDGGFSGLRRAASEGNMREQYPIRGAKRLGMPNPKYV